MGLSQQKERCMSLSWRLKTIKESTEEYQLGTEYDHPKRKYNLAEGGDDDESDDDDDDIERS